MQYEKQIKDSFGDPARITVGVDSADDCILFEIPKSAGEQMAFTPEVARRLARALKQAANVAEGNPAKKPKPAAKPDTLPRVIVDGEDDSWYRTDDGDEDIYTLGNHPDNGWRASAEWATDRTREDIRDNYGIKEERP